MSAFGISAMSPAAVTFTGAATRHSPSPRPGAAVALTPNAASATAHEVVASVGILGSALGVGSGGDGVVDAGVAAVVFAGFAVVAGTAVAGGITAATTAGFAAGAGVVAVAAGCGVGLSNGAAAAAFTGAAASCGAGAGVTAAGAVAGALAAAVAGAGAGVAVASPGRRLGTGTGPLATAASVAGVVVRGRVVCRAAVDPKPLSSRLVK